MRPNMIISLTLDAAGLALLLVLLLGYLEDHFRKDKQSRFFGIMTVIALVQLLLDGATWLIRGRILTAWVVSGLNTALFVMGYLLSMVFAHYLTEVITLKPGTRKRFLWASGTGGVLSILLAVTNPVTHIYFRVQDGLYQRTAGFPLSQLYFVLLMLGCFFLVLTNPAPRRVKATVLSYGLLPLAGVILQTLFYGTNLTYAVIPLALLLVYVNIQTARGQALAEQEYALSQARVAIMISQIQPHFLYNSLTAIMDLCGEDSKEARAAISDFAEYLRANLDSLRHSRLIPFEEELRHLEIYLRFEKMRFQERLRIVYDIQARGFMLPFLTVQPLVENAVKHGICKKPGGGTVVISTRELPDCIRVTVSDDGVGFDTRERIEDGRSHIGIPNIRSRIESLSRGTLEITSARGTGTMAVIQLPRTGEGWDSENTGD